MASLRALMTAALAAVAAALPGRAPDASGFSFTPAPSDQSTCGPPSFHIAGPSAPAMPPADWRHCAALFSSWAGRSGTFAVHDDSDDGGAGAGDGGGGNATLRFIPLLAARGCVLGVRAAGDGGSGGGGSGAWLMVGDGDVKGIMRTALEEWSRGSEIEVQGEVVCAAEEGGTGGLRWQIYGDERA
ncbi:hypothetical protein ESCO_001494 [Escovopsis weberi]|uniref:Ecp2 effector protein-like domain-containing protein n=1 Tax=Escovopsis weberi TaxID=150374 RepID=A0A0M8N7A2_ESCWE|nr:hypothetical protein ESCO_001494 [Escovopsis weberi]